jgi:hypothetical protein
LPHVARSTEGPSAVYVRLVLVLQTISTRVNNTGLRAHTAILGVQAIEIHAVRIDTATLTVVTGRAIWTTTVHPSLLAILYRIGTGDWRADIVHACLLAAVNIRSAHLPHVAWGTKATATIHIRLVLVLQAISTRVNNTGLRAHTAILGVQAIEIHAVRIDTATLTVVTGRAIWTTTVHPGFGTIQRAVCASGNHAGFCAGSAFDAFTYSTHAVSIRGTATKGLTGGTIGPTTVHVGFRSV